MLLIQTLSHSVLIGINTSAIQDTQTQNENKTPLATASSDKIQLNENPPVEGIQSSIDTTVSRKIFKVESDTLMKVINVYVKCSEISKMIMLAFSIFNIMS